MIDCLTCYRLHRNDGVLYCPFFDVQPCIRGKHRIGDEVLAEPKVQEENPEEQVAEKKPGRPLATKFPPSFYQYPPPAFTQPKARNGGNVIDWESVHDKIFELVRENCPVSKIADIIGVNSSTLAAYLRRYDPDAWERVEP